MPVIRKFFLLAVWLLVGYAILHPFTTLEPLKEPELLEEWQKPTRLSAMSEVDQNKLLQRLAYPRHEIPKKPLPDFNAIVDVTEKKKAFFDYLRPYIRQENQRLLLLRSDLQKIMEKKQKNLRLQLEDYAFLYSLYDEFRLEVTESDLNTLNELLLRVDIIPESLVLVQAANESAWGTSRFAVEGYNFFGQWCFREGCGMVPLQRAEDQFHEVARFDSPAQAIRSYFYNLNTFHTYEPLRQIRAQLRAENKPISAEALAQGLMAYSERGSEYIAEITSMIRFNRHLLEEG
ncbi:glucosaminidase domain-containing protein [Alishewanella sp. d11]|uniref:glucosaminidase domain-containing protein n=1 Tax=Alishewanella sp. d11 TaxID=3414030 RepID=UPI003BF8FAE4